MATDQEPKPMQHVFKRPSPTDQAKLLQVTQELSGSGNVPAQTSIATVMGPNMTSSYSRLSIGTTLDVPVKDLKRNPYNARQIVTMEGIDQLAMSLKKCQDVSASVFVDENGNLCLIDGHRRLEASISADLPTLRVEIRPRPLSDQELYLSSRRANCEREAQSPIDDALSWKKLIEKRIFSSQVEIANVLEIDQGIVSKIFSLAELPSSIIRQLADKPDLMNLRMLTAIRLYWKASDEIATGELILEIEKTDLSSRDVDRKRKSLETGKATRVRGVATPLTFTHGAAMVKRFDDKGTFNLEVSAIQDETRMEMLNTRINAVLEEVLNS